MSMQVQIQEGGVGNRLREISQALDGAGRAKLSRAMGKEVRGLIVQHLARLGVTRHATANRLGGQPTGYIAELAENFDQYSSVSVDQDGVSIQMTHPIISRAFRDLFIRPKNAKYLTIPVNGLAYGHSPREFAKVRFIKEGGHTGPKPPKKRKYPKNDLPTYVLVNSATVPQDRSLMPSHDELEAAGAKGMRNALRGIRRRGA